MDFWGSFRVLDLFVIYFLYFSKANSIPPSPPLFKKVDFEYSQSFVKWYWMRLYLYFDAEGGGIRNMMKDGAWATALT